MPSKLLFLTEMKPQDICNFKMSFKKCKTNHSFDVVSDKKLNYAIPFCIKKIE